MTTRPHRQAVDGVILSSTLERFEADSWDQMLEYAEYVKLQDASDLCQWNAG